MKIWILLAVSILALSATYVLTSVEVEKSVPPTIEIEIQSNAYVIDQEKSVDLIALVQSKQIAQGKSAGITLFADESISYQRVRDSMALLKNNGYEQVSLGAKEK